MMRILRRPKVLILTALGCSASFAMQVLFATFAITYGAEQGADQQALLFGFGFASLCQIFAVVGLGRLSDVVGRRPVMIAGLGLFAVLLHPMLQWIASGHVVLIVLAFVVGLTCHAMTYGPMAAFVSEQFGTTARYTGASLGYQLATLVGAGLTPMILTSLYASSGKDVLPVVWLLVATAVVSAALLLATRESKDNDLTAEHP